MKARLILLVAVFAIQGTSQVAISQTPEQKAVVAAREYSVAERGPHNRVWERLEYETGLGGRPMPRVHRYVELETGMHYLQDGEWRETREEFTITPEGYAVAEQGQHKVRISPVLNDANGTVEMITPAGQRLVSTPVAIGLYDRASGKRIWAGDVTNAMGQLVAPNVILFTNAFDGFQASIRHVYQKDGFHQDVILSERLNLNLLRRAGFSPDTAQIEIWTEFFESPLPRIKSRHVHREMDAVVRASMVDPDITDQDLDFGDIAMPTGSAFLAGEQTSDDRVEVQKRWHQTEGRTFLVESIPLPALAPLFAQLPPSRQSMDPNKPERLVAKGAIPAPTLQSRPTGTKHLAMASKSGRGHNEPQLILDYSTINTSQTNYTWYSDTTYYLSGNVSLYGTNTTFEGGTVLKYASNVVLTVNTPVTWGGEHYRPVVMISKNDNTAGQNISGSTGNTTYYSAATALYFNSVTANTNLVLSNLRVNSAKTAVAINGGAGHVLNHVQLVNCGNGFALTNAEVSLRNALCYQVLTNFTGSSSTGRVEHLTTHIATWLNQNIGANLFLTNSLLVAVTNLGTCTTQTVGTATSGGSVFQIVGAGAHYLATNSVYRNVGTTNIDASLLDALLTRTTYPPIVYSNTTYSSPLTLGPQAQRDTDLPDLGFHYDPIDYAFGGTTVAVDLTFQAGTRVAWFRTSSPYGIRLDNSRNMVFAGDVQSPCGFVRNNTVQEQANGNWAGALNSGGAINSFATVYALIPTNTMRFTRCATLADEQSYVSGYNGAMVANFQDCELYGGQTRGWVVTVGLTNCLLYGSHPGLEGGVAHYFVLRNCTVHRGSYYMNRWPESWGSPGTGLVPVVIVDTVFEGTSIPATGDVHKYDTNWTRYDYNAFLYGQNRTDPTGANDVLVTNSFNWQSSWLGNFYLPSDSTLIDVGSLTDASQIGLYHYTMLTDQTKEATAHLDIGYHYVATDGYGVPLDYDSDGIPDYWEDFNGNGVVDSGETDWQNAGDFGLRIWITEPKRSSNLP